MPVNFTANVGMEGEDHVLEVLEVLSRGVRDLLTERGGKGTLGNFPGGLVIRIPGFYCHLPKLQSLARELRFYKLHSQKEKKTGTHP